MNTDRELLEFAAKAEDRALGYWCDANQAFWCGVYWNPLTDDGDALRLVVKLNIWPVRRYDRDSIVVQRGSAYFDQLAECDIEGDALAATRRAIVMAAAEIGRAA